MSESTYDFVHLALYAMGGTIRGKTKLQKTVYFLGIMSGHVEELGYRPHFYGPYSDDVANAAGTLKALGFVDTCVTPWGVDSRGFEMARTDYKLNSDGQAIAEVKRKRDPDLWSALEQGAKLLDAAGDNDYMKLSVAAKTYFVLGKQDRPVPFEELAAHAHKFGWKVTPEEVREAASFLESLDLVRLA